MELNQLRYFLTLAETLHFSRAAKRLHISQQPLSYQIKQLENELGVKLFERTTRSVALTPAGAAFVTEVRAGLSRIDRGVERVRRFTYGDEGVLTIGYTEDTLFTVLPPILRQLRERYPQLEVVLLELGPAAFRQQLLSDDVDVGIMTWSKFKMPGLVLESIYQDRGMVALPKSHPLAKQEVISLRELANEPFVMYDRADKRDVFDELISLCHQAGFSPTISQEASTETVLIGLVAVGLGVALVSGGMSNLRTEEVAYRPLVDPTITLDVSLVWKESRQLPWLAGLRQIAQEVVRSIAPGEPWSVTE